MRVGSSLALVFILARPVAAAPPTDADRAFQRGRALMKAHRYIDACAAFELSQRLDPQLGTLFNLANCDVEIGKLATAWKLYRELAEKDANADRRALSKDLAAKLERRLPRLLVNVHPAVPGLEVTIDDVEATWQIGIATPLDVGAHTVAVTAPGFQLRNESIAVKEAEVAKLDVTLVSEIEVAPPPPAPEPLRDEPSSERARNGMIALLGGSAVVATGLVIGAFAVSDWDAAQKAMGADASTKSKHAVTLGNVSTAMVLVGLIPTVVGAYLWRTSGSAAVVTPTVGAAHAGLSIIGAF